MKFIDEQIKIEESIAKSKNEGHPITHQYGANCMTVIKKFVQEVAEEYNNGWIPCIERLPDKAGYEVLATLENGYGQRRVTIIFTGYGDSQWHCNHKEFDLDVWKVIAWQPLPEPFKQS